MSFRQLGVFTSLLISAIASPAVLDQGRKRVQRLLVAKLKLQLGGLLRAKGNRVTAWPPHFCLFSCPFFPPSVFQSSILPWQSLFILFLIVSIPLTACSLLTFWLTLLSFHETLDFMTHDSRDFLQLKFHCFSV